MKQDLIIIRQHKKIAKKQSLASMKVVFYFIIINNKIY